MFVDFNNQNGVPFHYVDTARIYAGGKTEPIVGAVIQKHGKPESGVFAIGTKAHPSVEGGLSAEGIKAQLKISLDAMAMTGLGEYYLHQPDTQNSLLESLQTAHEMVQKGTFCSVGMSNYHVSEMERAFKLCEQHNLTKPTVYQGLYNPLNRLVEKELLPLLKANQCAFVAYNPLAAGLLTGKHNKEGGVSKGRFKNNQNYLPRFYTDSNFEAIQLINTACTEEGISMVEATFRWLLCHSSLSKQDGILLGASSLDQLRENLDGCNASEKGPLPQSILDSFDAAWKLTEDGAFPYWRSYSSDMPNRESLDQGASYSASKTKK